MAAYAMTEWKIRIGELVYRITCSQCGIDCSNHHFVLSRVGEPFIEVCSGCVDRYNVIINMYHETPGWNSHWDTIVYTNGSPGVHHDYSLRKL